MLSINYRRAGSKEVPCKECKWSCDDKRGYGRSVLRCDRLGHYRVGNKMTCNLAEAKAKEVTP